MAGGQRLRIIGGSARGRTLRSMPGGRVRPTPAALRLALANMLRDSLAGAAVLDVCAGIGSVGLELLSQGAEWAVFLEKDGRAADLIRDNAAGTGLADRAEVWTTSAERGLERLAEDGQSFDFIFVDPPYDLGLALKLLERLAARPALLAPAGRICVQHTRREALPETLGGLVRQRERRAGDTILSFYGAQDA